MTYKIALFGKSKNRTRTTFHLYRAFQDQGHDILWINPARLRRKKGNIFELTLLEQLHQFEPHIVFIYSKDIPLLILREIVKQGYTTVQYYEDWAPTLPEGLSERARLVDHFLVTNKGMAADYQAAGIRNPLYFTGSCDIHDHWMQRAVLPHWKSDIAFIGAARSGEPRIELVKNLKKQYRTKVYGRNWHRFGVKPTLPVIRPRGYRLVCSGSKIVLGSDVTTDIEGYWSNRLWLTLGCGGFFLTNYVKGLEDFFENRKHLVWYRSQEECLELIREYLRNPRERVRIARQGYARVHAQHTFHHFIERVVALCEAQWANGPIKGEAPDGTQACHRSL